MARPLSYLSSYIFKHPFIDSDLTLDPTGELSAFLGASDEAEETRWEWVTGSCSFSLDDWGPGEPNNYQGQDCLVLANWPNWEDFEWFDTSCTHPRNFICEFV